MGQQSRRQPVRRSADEKLAIIAEYEQAPHGEKGAVMRRNGADRTLIGRWTAARDHGQLVPSDAKRVRPYGVTPPRQSREIQRLREKLARSEAENATLKTAIETVGKAHALLQMISESAEQAPLSPSSSRRQSVASSPTG